VAIREELAERDPLNAQWQTDVAVSCSKLGTLAEHQTKRERRAWLIRGREILAGLKAQGRLHPNRDWIAWFDTKLAETDDSTI
jgi:hypothetical protein